MPNVTPNVSVDKTTHAHGPHFTVPASAVETPDLRSLQQTLEQIASTCHARNEAIAAYIQLAKSLTNAQAIGYAQRKGTHLTAIKTKGQGDSFQSTEARELMLHWSSEACLQNAVQLNRFADRHETIATLPIYVHGQPTEAISAALLVPRGQIEPFVVSLQLVATAIGSWYSRDAARQNEFEATASAATIELLSRCHDARNIQEAAFILVNEMQKYVDCESVALGLRRGNSRRIKIVAMSGNGTIDQRSDVVTRITEAAEESLDRDGLTVWPPLSMDDHHTTRVHQQLVGLTRYNAVASHPICTDDDVIGTWLFLDEPNIIHRPSILNFITAATPHVASTLALRKQADAGPMTRVRKIVQGTPDSRRTRTSILAGAVLTALLMLIPIPHRISCDCTVEPTIRRFASVPYNGVLRDSLVEPGDLVSANQVLARMDDRDLRFEKSEAMKTREIAMKEFDKQRAAYKIADAQIAKLRAKEMDAKLDWIEHREEHLEIKSPIDGFVLDGDLEDAEGASVQRGQMLFEVALDALELKLAIPEDEIFYTRTEMQVTAKLDGAPGKRIDAELRRITPRANAETGTNVFLADATLLEQDQMLRPGMSGTAKVVGPYRPVGWILFHKAYRKITDMIDW